MGLAGSGESECEPFHCVVCTNGPSTLKQVYKLDLVEHTILNMFPFIIILIYIQVTQTALKTSDFWFILQNQQLAIYFETRQQTGDKSNTKHS